MGSWFGGELALAGNEVQLLSTNAAHRDAVAADGLVLRSAAGERRVALPIHAPEAMRGPVDLVLLFTKSFQSEAAMASVAPALDEATTVLSLQNGLGNAEAIARHVPPSRTLLGVSMMPVDRVAPGVVASTGEGASWFGLAEGGTSPVAARVLEAFAPTPLALAFDEDVRRRLWEKVAFNAGMNATCALTRGSPGSVGELPEARALVRDVAREVATLAAARDIAVDLERVFATIDYACAHHGAHKASMLQDLEAGRRTEIEALNGAVARLAEEAGVAVPLNRLLATLVRLAERSPFRDG